MEKTYNIAHESKLPFTQRERISAPNIIRCYPRYNTEVAKHPSRRLSHLLLLLFRAIHTNKTLSSNTETTSRKHTPCHGGNKELHRLNTDQEISYHKQQKRYNSGGDAIGLFVWGQRTNRVSENGSPLVFSPLIHHHLHGVT